MEWDALCIHLQRLSRAYAYVRIVWLESPLIAVASRNAFNARTSSPDRMTTWYFGRHEAEKMTRPSSDADVASAFVAAGSE